MKCGRALGFWALGYVCLACGGAGSRQITADGEGVREVTTGIIAADNERDIERVLGYYADDATLFPPNEAPVVGREAIRPRYEMLFAQYDPAIEGTVREVAIGGDVAYVWGENGGWLRGRGAAEDRQLHDVYLMTLRKDDAGVWRINRLMWHSSVPAAAP